MKWISRSGLWPLKSDSNPSMTNEIGHSRLFLDAEMPDSL